MHLTYCALSDLKVGRDIAQALSEKAELVQLSVVSSDPGALEQHRHSDTTFDRNDPFGGNLLTVFSNEVNVRRWVYVVSIILVFRYF